MCCPSAPGTPSVRAASTSPPTRRCGVNAHDPQLERQGEPVMTRIAIVGSGYMGGGIAQIFALAGHDVVISDVTAEIAQSNLERLRTETAEFEQQGLFAAGSTAIIAERMSAAASIEEAVASADFVEEAVPER